MRIVIKPLSNYDLGLINSIGLESLLGVLCDCLLGFCFVRAFFSFIFFNECLVSYHRTLSTVCIILYAFCLVFYFC